MVTEKLEAKIIAASKELQKRVGTGKIDEKVIESAQRVMDENKVDFGPVAAPHLKEIQAALNEAKAHPDDHKAIMESLRTPIMNLKANAGTFNFNLISDLTGAVLMFLENVKEPDKKILQIVDLLHKTILLILAYDISGDGGELGKELLEAFTEVCHTHQKKLVEKGRI